VNPALARAGIFVLSLLVVWRVLVVNILLLDESGRTRLPAEARGGADEDSTLRRLLDENPTEVAPLLVIAGRHAAKGERELATRAYGAALEMAPLQKQVLAAAAAHFLALHHPHGVELLVQLVAHHADTRDTGFPVLAQLAASSAHSSQVMKALSNHPPWEGAFLLDACRRGVDGAVLAPLLAARQAAVPAAGAESACAVEALRTKGRWVESYHLWLNLLPKARLRQGVGYVFNGGFEDAPVVPGYDWMLQADAERSTGHSGQVRTTAGATGKAALRVAYNGRRQSGVPAAQYLALRPGTYELSGLARPESLNSVRGLQWVVRCAQAGETGAVLGQSERFLGSSEWRPFSAAVQVPESCPGQVLRLEPALDSGATAFISGVAWFDDLKLSRR
jgi:hypothetical protein